MSAPDRGPAFCRHLHERPVIAGRQVAQVATSFPTWARAATFGSRLNL